MGLSREAASYPIFIPDQGAESEGSAAVENNGEMHEDDAGGDTGLIDMDCGEVTGDIGEGRGKRKRRGSGSGKQPWLGKKRQRKQPKSDSPDKAYWKTGAPRPTFPPPAGLALVKLVRIGNKQPQQVLESLVASLSLSPATLTPARSLSPTLPTTEDSEETVFGEIDHLGAVLKRVQMHENSATLRDFDRIVDYIKLAFYVNG